jgi:type II secretory pathway component PulF
MFEVRIAEGKQLHEAMGSHRDVFSDLTLSIIRAGTEGAFLEAACSRRPSSWNVRKNCEPRSKERWRIRHFLRAAGSTVTLVLIVFFVPKFSELFASAGTPGNAADPP